MKKNLTKFKIEFNETPDLFAKKELESIKGGFSEVGCTKSMADKNNCNVDNRLSKKFLNLILILAILTSIISCKKEENAIGNSNDNLQKSSINQSIKIAEDISINYRNELEAKMPSIGNAWEEMGISFDESKLPKIKWLETSYSPLKDTINVNATDKDGNNYSLQLVSFPYKKGNNLKSINRWPTANEWSCLGISLAGAILSAGVGTFATVANFVAVAASEKKSSNSNELSIIIKGFYNNKPEFILQEDVFTAEDGTTHMDGYLTVNENQSIPVFVANGVINNESVSIMFRNNEDIICKWDNVTDPTKFITIPDPIKPLITYYKDRKAPYTIHSSRNALQGELIRILFNK